MVERLLWKEDEGYDIHVLRGGPASKALDSALVLDSSTNALPPKFTPRFKNAANLGVSVDPKTGEVTAQPQPATGTKFPNFNFIITAQQIIGGSGTLETKIRVHVHESIQQIWLTPSTLSAHIGADERRFTVLALFDDGTVGDITNWPSPQLVLTSSDPNVVTVLLDGRLQAKKADKTAQITAALKLSTPPINKTAGATAFAQPSWDDVGKAADVAWVAGPIRPNESDLGSNNPDGVDAVVEGNVNVLFISEGFRKDDEKIFRRKIVDVVVNKQLLAEENLQPFKLLGKSINYWSVFLESRQDSVTVLGDAQTTDPIASPVPLPLQPTPSAIDWTAENMAHEGGMRVPKEPPAADAQGWVTTRATIYDLPSGLPNTPGIRQAEVQIWNEQGSRLLLNEVDSAFGLAHYDRPRVSGQEYSLDLLQLDPRRMSDASLQAFVGNLRFGEDPSSGNRYEIGASWVENTFRARRGKDEGLICFVCWSGTRGGGQSQKFGAPKIRFPYFSASVGRGERVVVKPAANGRDIIPPKLKEFSPPVFASLVAYGFGQVLRLGDESGDGAGKAFGRGTGPAGDNLQTNLANVSGGVRSIDATKIRWLWPRIANVALIDLQIDALTGTVTSPEKCDQNGNPNPRGAFLLVKLLRPPLKPFAKSEVVRIRASFEKLGSDIFWQHPSGDEIVAFPLEVEQPGTTSLVLAHRTPILPQLGYFGPTLGTKLEPSMLSKVETCFLISPLIEDNHEVKLVADPVRQHIDTTDSPLNAPPGAQGQACTVAPHARADVPATNLPAGLSLPKGLATKADIIGIYDGGGGFDCEVFRPAGRCRMRRGLSATTPFCAVCRYFIVDHLDPMAHKVLNDLYEQEFPR
jgi:hypothetical protein